MNTPPSALAVTRQGFGALTYAVCNRDFAGINFETRSTVAHRYHPDRAQRAHRNAAGRWKGIGPRLESCELRGERR